MLFVGGDNPEDREEWVGMLQKASRSIACSVGVVVPGAEREDGELLVAADRGPHGRAAVNLAAALAADADRSLTGLYVEPDIGPDAEAVGRRILDRLLKGALDDEMLPRVARQVVIHNDPAKGIVETCRKKSFELLVLGADRPGAIGELRSNSVPRRVVRSRPDATLVALRDTLPLERRLSRWLLQQMQRRIPQLARAERVDLVERIQSNCQWNFDFMLLILLSTLIAALGLLDNSPAVIIGAMLVAPLMTPLLGFGLAIAQGNTLLARLTIKATLLGFFTAFCVAYVIGLLFSDFHEATAEMASRDWPQMLDLLVAFVSGLAAAYASARPGLLAALPGVAIAAALLPPVATAGLATSIGHYDLALGALLLFAVNMVAIIFAAVVSLWVVGIRHVRETTRVTRHLGRAVTVATIATALFLTFSPPLLQPPAGLRQAVKNTLPDELRLRRMRLHEESGVMNVQVDVGGSVLPDHALGQRLGKLARKHLGEGTGVRLTFRYETLVK